MDIDEKPIPPELNSPSGVGATATPSSVSAPSQPFPSSANANRDPTYPGDIDTFSVCSRVEDGLAQDHFKGEPSASSTPTQSSPLKSPTDKDDKTETLPCLTPVAPVGDYILQPTVFSSAVGALVRDDILQPTAFSSAGAFEHPKVYDFVNTFLTTAKLHLNNCQTFGLEAVLGYGRRSMKIVHQSLDDPELPKYINMIRSPASEWIPTGISKDEDRPVFTLNGVVDGSHDNSLKRWHSSVLVVQTRINEGKEEMRIVQYPSPKVVITHALDEAERNGWSLRCSFAFIGYAKDGRCKEVLKAIKNHVLIDGIFVLI